MNKRLFAIGDIHGCFDSVKELVENKIQLQKIDKLILIGDYIDRGNKSKEVVDFIIELLDDGYDIVLMKPEFPAKDINDMVLAGFTDIHKIVDMCRHQGLRARLELNNWRKC